MVRVFRHYVAPVKLVLITCDIVILIAAAYWGEYLRLWFLDAMPDASWQAFTLRAALAVMTASIFLAVGLYQADALRHGSVMLVRLLVALALAFIALSVIGFLLPSIPLWRSIVLAAMLLAVVGVGVAHVLVLRLSRLSSLRQKLIVIGAGTAALELRRALAAAPETPVEFAGAISVGAARPLLPPADVLNVEGALNDHVSAAGIDSLVIAHDVSDPDFPTEEVLSCRLAGCEVRDIRDFMEQSQGFVPLEQLSTSWFLFSSGFNGPKGLERRVKRFLDIGLALLLLVATLPLTIIVACLIKLESSGPVFYVQRRIGLDDRPFLLLKFRSMRASPQDGEDARWAEANDPRVTTVGKFIRPTRIDEIPQALNVLRGDMSFVGPRPEQPEFVEILAEKLPYYRVRHSVKPGITGWAQIHLPYAASQEDSRLKLEHDLYYIKNFSLFLDLLIALQTLRVVLFRHGAR